MAYEYYTAVDGSTHLRHASISNPGRKPGELSTSQRIQLNKKITENAKNKKGQTERYDTNGRNTVTQNDIKQAKIQAESYFNNVGKYADDNGWDITKSGQNAVCENKVKSIKFTTPLPSGISPATWRSFNNKDFEGVGGTKEQYNKLRDFAIELKQKLMNAEKAQQRSNIFNSNMAEAKRKAEEEQRNKNRKAQYANSPFKSSKA